MEITELLRRVHAGDQAAVQEVIPLVYDELKKLASAHLRREASGGTLETTALVHEAFLRLAGSRHPEYENRAHFFGIAARLMRQILVDAARARARATQKRDGLEGPLTDLPDLGQQSLSSFLIMNQALDRLKEIDPRQVELLELRYFAGMTAEESAEVMSIPVHAVRRELRLAQARLRREIEGQ